VDIAAIFEEMADLLGESFRQARCGWPEKAHVINTHGLADLKKRLRATRG